MMSNYKRKQPKTDSNIEDVMSHDHYDINGHQLQQQQQIKRLRSSTNNDNNENDNKSKYSYILSIFFCTF